MNNIIKCYLVRDNNESDVDYGCLIMNRDVDFDATLFQQRLNEERETYHELDTEDEIVKIVLSKYDYRDISYIPGERTFYI